MLLSLLFAANLLAPYQETLYSDWGQTFAVDELLYHEKTDFWDLNIFENRVFGRVMALDGVIQFTEKDEFCYHEMMAHVPLLTHPDPKSVLIIGGGDGGLLREVLRHEYLEKILQVEIDPRVIGFSKTYFPKVSAGAYENSRAELLIQDAAEFVRKTDRRFDVILVDSNDPEGAAQVLFSSEFYRNCKRVLNPGGILVNQNGVPFLQKKELSESKSRRALYFKNVTFYTASVPTYVGGLMAFGWASDKKYRLSNKALKKRLSQIKGPMRYYTPAIHKASFALPQFMLDDS